MVGVKTHRSSTPLAKKAAWFLLPVLPYLNAKRVTKTCNLFAALQRNEFKNYSAGFTTYVQTCLAKNQVVASCVNIDFWLGRITRGHAIHTGFRHLLQNKFVVKSRTSLCFFFFATATTLMFAKEVWWWVIKRPTSLFNSFGSKRRSSCVWRDSRKILSNHTRVFTKLATTLLQDRFEHGGFNA